MRAERGLSSSFLRQFRSQIVFSTTLQTIKQWSPSVLCVWLRLCSGKWKPTVLCVVIIQQTFAKIHFCVYGIVKFPEETIKLLHFSLNCSLMRNILENVMTWRGTFTEVNIFIVIYSVLILMWNTREPINDFSSVLVLSSWTSDV